MRKAILVVIIVTCFVSLLAFAEEPIKPAKYIWIETVAIAEGKSESYPGLVAQYRHAVEAVKSDSYWLAATGLTGDRRHATFVSGYNTMGEVEKILLGSKEIAAELKRNNPNFWAEASASELEPYGTVAVYREDLSYQPEKVSAAEGKWWMVQTIHLAPGYRTEFTNLMKEEIELLKKAKLDEHFIVYECMAGLPTTGSAYYIVTHMKSLSEMDIDRSEQTMAVFTPMVREHFEAIVRRIVTKAEDNLYMVRPELSRPPATFVAANPEFWTVKEPAPLVAKGKGKKLVTEAEIVKPKLDRQ